MEDGKYDECPEEGKAPNVMGVVKIIRNAWLGLVGPVQGWKWRRCVAQRGRAGDMDAVDHQFPEQ